MIYKSLKKSASAKAVSVSVGFAMAFTLMFGGAVAPAQAASVEELTAQIASLLATITSLQAQLTSMQGGTPASTASYTFTSNLSMGMDNVDVLNLQKVLNMDSATMIASSGVGSAGNETSYFGSLTKAAVIKFQDKYASEVLSPVGLSKGTGYVGASTRAKLNMIAMPSTPSTTVDPSAPVVVVPTGTVLSVALSGDTPATSAVVAGQSLADLAHYTFTNPTASDVKVTNVTLQRIGVSADATLSNIYLFDGVERLTDSATVSSGVISLNSTLGLFTVPAGSS
ncbi:peptidoglycan-binding protein, partial [Patescibacteria group bacterium]